MIRAGMAAAAAVLFAISAARGQTNGPPFKEVFELVRTNLSGLSQADIDQAALEGLLNHLSPRVFFVTNDPAVVAASNAPPVIVQSNLFEGNIFLARITQVRQGTAMAFKSAYDNMAATHKISGIALDLRYCKGSDYSAAAKLADLFLKTERPLLDWGQGMVKSTAKSSAINVPVAILVNSQTSGAAEALAALLRDNAVGLLIGSKTAGAASVGKEFVLSNGQKLWIASSPVKLGNGTETSAKGVTPDIQVKINPDEERLYYADAFRVIPTTNLVTQAGSTNAAPTNHISRRARFSEAELVREKREGISPETLAENVSEREPEKPVVHDPALARALDLLKGLAVVQRARS